MNVKLTNWSSMSFKTTSQVIRGRVGGCFRLVWHQNLKILKKTSHLLTRVFVTLVAQLAKLRWLTTSLK